MAHDDSKRLIASSHEIDQADNCMTITNVLPARRSRITTEIPLFLILLGVSLSGATINNILLYRTCVHSLNHPVSVCRLFLAPEKSNITRKLEEEVQKYATYVSTARNVIEALVPAGLSFFLGVWSNTHGRKPLIIWPLFGMSFTGILTVVYAMLDGLGPWWFIIAVLPLSMTGGFTVLLTGAYCYLSDVTTVEARSLRMTILEASLSVGSFFGLILSSYLLKAVGNVYLLLIVAVLYVAAYSYSNICLTESLNDATQGGICSVLDFLLVKEMMRECFKQRPNRGRAQILLLTFANSLTIFVFYGLMNLDYLYARDKLHWALKDYTTYSAVNTVLSFCGSFFGIMFFQKLLRVGDLPLAIGALLSMGTEFIIKAIATNSWYMYVGAAITVLKGLSSPMIRSLLTKIVPVEDIAKVFALMCAIEGVSPIIANVMYNSLYEFSLGVFPGAIYILSTGILGGCAASVILVQYFRWKSSVEYERVVSDEPSSPIN